MHKLIKKIEGLGLTRFQKDVLISTLSIPKGETRTYKQIASSVGHNNAYRAVGNTLKKNPFPLVIPCHRVIKSDGKIGNYVFGCRKKEILLKKEGVKANAKKK